MIATDLGELKAYIVVLEAKKRPRIYLIEDVAFVNAHHRVAEMVTDMAGRHARPTAKAWTAPIADDHNIQLETERRLLNEIAFHIKHIIDENDHQGVWLAAHKEMHRQLLDELPHQTRAMIEKELPRDLVKADKFELLEQFWNP